MAYLAALRRRCRCPSPRTRLAALGLCLAALLPVTAAPRPDLPAAAAPRPTPAAGRGAARRGPALRLEHRRRHRRARSPRDLWLVPRLGLQPPYLVVRRAAARRARVGARVASADSRPRPARALLRPPSSSRRSLVPRWKPWDPVLMSAGVHRYGLEWRDRAGTPARSGRGCASSARCSSTARGDEAVVAVSEPKGSARGASCR